MKGNDVLICGSLGRREFCAWDSLSSEMGRFPLSVRCGQSCSWNVSGNRNSCFRCPHPSVPWLVKCKLAILPVSHLHSSGMSSGLSSRWDRKRLQIPPCACSMGVTPEEVGRLCSADPVLFGALLCCVPVQAGPLNLPFQCPSLDCQNYLISTRHPQWRVLWKDRWLLFSLQTIMQRKPVLALFSQIATIIKYNSAPFCPYFHFKSNNSFRLS